MTETEFLEGFAVLLAQPYGRYLAGDEAKCALQEKFFFDRFGGYEAVVWQQAMIEWIETQTEWPTIPDLLARVKYFNRPIREAQERAAQQARIEQEAQERTRREALPPPPVRLGPSRADIPWQPRPTVSRHGEQRESFSTDFSAKGMIAICPGCKNKTEIFVCWCETLEGCASCLSTHLPHCPGFPAKLPPPGKLSQWKDRP